MAQLNSEPAGPRRVTLALKESGHNQSDVAVLANCDRTWVSYVINGSFKRVTPLIQRVMNTIVGITGRSSEWLFEHHRTHIITRPGDIP